VDNRQSTYLKKLEKQKTRVTIKVRSCEFSCFQNQNPKDGFFTPKETGAKNQVKSRRVERPVIVHFKTWRSHASSVASEVERWIVEEVWADLMHFRSCNLDFRPKSYGLYKVLASLPQKKKKSSNIRPTYVQTLRILSMNIIALTIVTNPTYRQTLTQENRSHMLRILCICVQRSRSKP
jgi:hypothetical protein